MNGRKFNPNPHCECRPLIVLDSIRQNAYHVPEDEPPDPRDETLADPWEMVLQ